MTIDEGARLAFDIEMKAQCLAGWSFFTSDLQRKCLEAYEQAKPRAAIDEEALEIATEAFYLEDASAAVRRIIEAYERTKKTTEQTVECRHIFVNPTRLTGQGKCVYCNAKQPIKQESVACPTNTALVKKLVDALRRTASTFEASILEFEGYGAAENDPVLREAEEALTEAQAWLERQGKCGEGES